MYWQVEYMYECSFCQFSNALTDIGDLIPFPWYRQFTDLKMIPVQTDEINQQAAKQTCDQQS